MFRAACAGDRGHRSLDTVVSGVRTRMPAQHRTPSIILTLLLAAILLAVISAGAPAPLPMPFGNASVDDGGMDGSIATANNSHPSGGDISARSGQTADESARSFEPTPSPAALRTYTRTYSWDYGMDHWFSTVTIAEDTYHYYRSKPHNRERDYAQYALSDYDRTFLQKIVATFEEAGRQKGYSDYDTIMNVVAFVQALPYTSDNVTTGYDEYPRYPLETLVDNGGDCEDSAILTAALLREMGYESVLIEISHHMAVGVVCTENRSGTYYEYQGSQYYYLETTGTGWEIGELPEIYRKYGSVTIHPMIQVPRMEIAFTANLTDYNTAYAYYRVHCTVANIGSGTARNPRVYIGALALSGESESILLPDHTIDLANYSEGSTGWAEATVRIPRGQISQIICRLSGENFAPVEIRSECFTL
jgi:predicted transglutaminase-like cysteine proteinase